MMALALLLILPVLMELLLLLLPPLLLLPLLLLPPPPLPPQPVTEHRAWQQMPVTPPPPLSRADVVRIVAPERRRVSQRAWQSLPSSVEHERECEVSGLELWVSELLSVAQLTVDPNFSRPSSYRLISSLDQRPSPTRSGAVCSLDL